MRIFILQIMLPPWNIYRRNGREETFRKKTEQLRIWVRKLEKKKRQRNKMKDLRDALSEDEILNKGYTIMEKTVAHYDFRKAKNILVYMHTGSEVRTDGIIAYGLILGKRVYVPRVKEQKMEFHEIKNIKECEPGSFGILEPPDEASVFDFDEEMEKEDTLMILPGLAFDGKGGRLGYGGGFYDRYLAKHPNCIKMGIAYDFQFVKKVVKDEHDIPVDILITDQRIMLNEEGE